MTYKSSMKHLRDLLRDPAFDPANVFVGRRDAVEVPLGEQEGDELIGHMSDGTPVYMRVAVRCEVPR